MHRSLPHRTVFNLAVPMIISNLSVPLLGIVDTAILGHLNSPRYLAAVAAGATIMSFLFWGFGFLRMGTTSLVGQAMGKQDITQCQRLLWLSIILATALGLLLLALQGVILPLALFLIKPSTSIAELTMSYCQIRMLSAPAALVNFAIIGWFIGMQNTRAPLLIVVATNVLNIILDWLLIVVLGKQSDGAAIATAIADYSGLATALLLLHRQHRLNRNHHTKFAELLCTAITDFKSLGNLLRINQQLFLRTICLMFTFAFFTAQGARLSDSILAANAILMQLLLLTSYGLDGFAHAAEALIGKSTGAGDRSSFLDACKAVTLWSLIIALLFTLCFIIFKRPIVAIFSDIELITNLVSHYYIWLYFLPLISAWSYLFDGIFIGSGKTRTMQNSMFLACFGVFIPIWWLTQAWGNNGLWFAFFCFNATRGISLGWMFFHNTRQWRWF